MKKKAFILFLFLIQFKAFPKKIILNICANDVKKSLKPDEKYETPSLDILMKSISNLKGKLEISINIDFMPMDRCIVNARRGEIDAVLDVSYTKERAEALEYPPGSGPDEVGGACSSELKMSCSKYMILTPKANFYTYSGKQNTLPIPVRASRGYSIAKKLEEEYKENLELSKNDLICLKKMIRDKTGCVIANFGYIPGIAENQFKEVLDQVKIDKIPYEMRSNYIPFSKKSNFSKEEKFIFWKELSTILKDKKSIEKIKNKYLKK